MTPPDAIELQQAAVDAVITEAAAMFRVTPEAVRGHGRSESVRNARAVAIALARQRYGWSYPELGRAFGRDHSTCFSSVKRAAKLGYVLELEKARAAE